jgi:hypothetical protein
MPFLFFFSVIILATTAESFKVSTTNYMTSAQSILPALSLLYIISLIGTLLVCCTSCIGLACPDSFCCQDIPDADEFGEKADVSNGSAGESLKLVPISAIRYL